MDKDMDYLIHHEEQEKFLNSNDTNADASSEGVKTFGSDGYTMGTYYNQSGRTYVSWNWRANGSTTTTNDASATGIGTIDSVLPS